MEQDLHADARPPAMNHAWTDEPVQRIEEDDLERAHIARQIAALVTQNHSWDTSRVYGLTGAWGSGKSSVINMVCEVLERQQTATADESSRWVVARFTPWATDTTSALLVEFYAAFASALPKGRKARKARSALSSCLKAAAPLLKFVPGIGEVLSLSAAGASMFLSRQPAWNDAFTKFSTELAKLRVRVLVVADDIDRLQHDELVTLLKVVRLLGRFPGVDYLLAYDEQTLFSNLVGVDLGAPTSERARLFMEKIVQYPLVLPPLLPHQIQKRLDVGWNRILVTRGGISERHRRLALLLDIFVRQLPTPRSIDRYLAQAGFILSMHTDGETDDVDLLLLTFVHMRFPGVYAQLPEWQGRLTATKSLSEMVRTGRDEPTDFSRLLAGVGTKDVRDARRVLTELFPVLSNSSRRSRPHASHPDYFARYFVHMVPEGDIPDAAISDALNQASSADAGHELMDGLLTDETNPDRPDLAIAKLWEASAPDRGEPTARPVTLALVAAVAEVLPRLKNGTNSLFRRQERATYWAAELIRRLPDSTTPSELVDAVNSCDDLNSRLRLLWVAATAPSGTYTEVGTGSSLALEAGALVVDDAVTYCLGHLAQRNEADPDARITFPLMFAARFGDLGAVRSRVHERLGVDFETEDLAARCVSVAYLVAPNPRGQLDGFDNDLFSALAPLDDPFYDTIGDPNINDSDLSWSNRIRFAHGRAQRPERLPERYLP